MCGCALTLPNSSAAPNAHSASIEAQDTVRIERRNEVLQEKGILVEFLLHVQF